MGEGGWVPSFFVQGAWQSVAFAAQSTQPLVEKVVANRWTTLDTHVRQGLTLSVPFFQYAKQQPTPVAVSSLVQAATEDDDEWVRLMGRAVGAAPGRLDFDAVMSEDAKVRLEATGDLGTSTAFHRIPQWCSGGS